MDELQFYENELLRIAKIVGRLKEERGISKGVVVPKVRLKAGTIIHRKDGLYEGRIYVGDKRPSVYARSELDCIKKLNALYELGSVALVDTLYKLLDFWLDEYSKPNIQSETYDCYKSAIVRVKRSMKDINLRVIKPLHIQKCLSSMPDSRSRDFCRLVLGAAAKVALANGLIKTNYMLAIKVKKHKSVSSLPLTIREQLLFENVCKTAKCGNYYLFCLYSGCRRSEACRIKWTDIDIEHNRIFIPGSKTNNAPRYIPCFDKLKEILSTIPRTGEKIFSHSVDHVTRMIQFIDIGRHVAVKDLRSTFATRCYEAGIPEKVVSDWMGHYSSSLTKDKYVQSLNDYSAQSGDKLDAFLKRTLVFNTPNSTTILNEKSDKTLIIENNE